MSGRRKPKTVAEGWVPITHGIPSSYVRGCRCDECRAANTARHLRNGYSQTNRRARFAERELINGRLVHPNPYGGHGSITAVTSCGCQCEPCRAANSQWQREYRRRKRATS